MLLEPSLRSCVRCGFYRLLRVFYLSGAATASQNRAPNGLGGIVGGGASSFRERRTGVIQALSKNAMRFSSIAIASLQRPGESAPQDCSSWGHSPLAGSDSPILGRSLTINGMKTNYTLPRGSTSFIIRLAGSAQDRSFTFVNENAAAEGRLLIAVSNQPLAADSPLWSAVAGAIRFGTRGSSRSRSSGSKRNT